MYSTHPLVRGEAAAKQSQVNNDILMGFYSLSIPLNTQWLELKHSQIIAFNIRVQNVCMDPLSPCSVREAEKIIFWTFQNFKKDVSSEKLQTQVPQVWRQQRVSLVQEMLME